MAQTQERLSANARRAYEIYEQQLRSQIETPENIGKLVAIDTTSGDYEISDDGIDAALRLQANHNGRIPFTIRIGYNAVEAVGGSLERIKR